MPRPADVTDDDIREWEEARQRWIRDNPDDLLREPPPVVWYAGVWLRKQLKALNCTKELAEQIEMAAGQRQAYAKDYWQTVVTAVENYKKGKWETPGPELAMKLMQERFGKKPDPMEVLDSLIKDGADPEKLFSMVMQARMNKILVIKKKPE